MDLEENIRISARSNASKFYLEGSENHGLIENGFILGAKSQAAREYWYAQYESERNIGLENLKEQLSNFKSKIEYFHDKDDVKNSPHVCDGKHPNYHLGTVQSDPLYGATKKNLEDAISKYFWTEPIIMTDFEKYKKYMRDYPDPSFSFQDWKDMMSDHKEEPQPLHNFKTAEGIFVDKDEWISKFGKVFIAGKTGHPIDIVLSEKWYRPNIFDKTDLYDINRESKEITINVGPGKSCMQESHILREHAKNGGSLYSDSNK